MIVLGQQEHWEQVQQCGGFLLLLPTPPPILSARTGRHGRGLLGPPAQGACPRAEEAGPCGANRLLAGVECGRTRV